MANSGAESLTRPQISDRVRPWLPNWVSADEATSGVLLSLRPPDQRTRAVEKSLNEPGVVYAWREEDASATKLAFEVLAHLGEAVVTGPHGILKLGFALKDLVCFLIDLHRHRVRISDPVEVSVLLSVRQSPDGLTSEAIRQRLSAAQAPTLTQIEDALERLSAAPSAGGPKELVRAYGQKWKCLV